MIWWIDEFDSFIELFVIDMLVLEIQGDIDLQEIHGFLMRLAKDNFTKTKTKIKIKIIFVYIKNTRSMENKKISCKWQECCQEFDEEIQVYNHIVATHSESGKKHCKWSIQDGQVCSAVLQSKNILREHAVAHFSNAVKFLLLI